jgi:prolyl oligopeptidase
MRNPPQLRCIACVALLVACSKTQEKAGPTAKPAASSSAGAVQAGAPATPRHDVVDHYFGVAVHDPYRWLEKADSPDVVHWIEAENTHTDRVLGGMPGRSAMAERVKALALTTVQRFSPELSGGRLFFMQQTPPQAQPVLATEPWPTGATRVLVDTNASSATAITNYWPSPDGRYVAYGTAEGGSEATTIHVVRAADAKRLPDALPRAGGGTTPQGLAWDRGSKGFIYVRLPLPGTAPANELEFNAALYHHELGRPASADTLVFGKDLSEVAEYSFAVSDQGRTAVLVHFGDGNPDRVYMRSGTSYSRVLGPEANVRAGDASVTHGGAASWQGNRLLVVSYQDAPRGRLLGVDANGKSSVLVPEQAWAMNGVYAFKGGFLLAMVAGPAWRVDQYDTSGHRVRSAPLPDGAIGLDDVAANDASDRVLLCYEGWNFPERWATYDTGSGSLKTIFEVKPAADYSKVRSRVIGAVSKDGTHVPVSVVSLEGTKPDDHRPTLLTAYGGYGIAVRPRFAGPYLAWLERGGVFAVANIRGGGEYGEGWHEAGMLKNKQNGFDDFFAAAQALVKQGFTDTRHLGIVGGSNGGLLMGTELTQHPNEFHAVVSFVGIYDMLRAELWPNGRYNVSEYGTVTQEPDFEWLDAYSPLQHVKQGVAYPAILLETGVNDPRVAPWQSRKFAAALQAATSSSRPILLLTRMNEGHGVTASFSQRVGNTAAALAFFAHELGLGKASSN